MAGRQNWAIFIAYVGALRLVLVACSQAIRAYASVSRFYPQISRYYLFTKDVQHLDTVPFGKVSAGDRLASRHAQEWRRCHCASGGTACLGDHRLCSGAQICSCCMHDRNPPAVRSSVAVFDLKDSPVVGCIDLVGERRSVREGQVATGFGSTTLPSPIVLL